MRWARTLKAGYLKIAIFEKDGYPTHACRQLPSQKWTSKMGWDGVDIEHNDLECIARRPVRNPIRFPEKAGSQPSHRHGGGR